MSIGVRNVRTSADPSVKPHKWGRTVIAYLTRDLVVASRPDCRSHSSLTAGVADRLVQGSCYAVVSVMAQLEVDELVQPFRVWFDPAGFLELVPGIPGSRGSPIVIMPTPCARPMWRASSMVCLTDSVSSSGT